MRKKIRFICVFLLLLGPGLNIFAAAPASDDKKTAAELAVTEPLEIWGHLRGENSPEPSTEYLEKMAVDFDKINNALCAAAAQDNIKELQFLLRDGASPDSTDSLGISALSHAILGNNKEAFSLLMSAGANSNQKGPFGVTPLMLAANSNLTEMVSLLLLNGADPQLKNDDGDNALSIASRKKLHEVINLLKPPPPKAPPKAVEAVKKIKPQEEAPTADAVEAEAAKNLAQPTEPARQIKPSAPAPTGPFVNLTPQEIDLLQAVKQGLTETAAQLIQEGANPNVKTQDKLSPLVIAVSRSDITSAEMLLRQHANANIQSEFDMTPLMLAVQSENPPMIRLLLQSGADPHTENIAGQSACDLGLASTEASIRALFNRCLE